VKNFLIVIGVLFGCFVVACILVLMPTAGGGKGYAGGKSYMIATWRDYDDPDLKGLQVTVGTDRIDVDVPATPTFKRIEEKGHWNLHAFYCDTHLDAPAEMIVARELKNEDLELDVGHFIPSHPGKIVCVKMSRICEPFPYPTTVPGQTVTYPPPKGLIRPGMLECDLQMLPWHSDKVEVTPTVVTVDTTTLSDGKKNQNYFSWNQQNEDDPSSVYYYHSDRSDAPQLLVTVYHGRVVQVVGGAEETADIPYQLPPPPAPEVPHGQDNDTDTGWAGWLFDLLFKK
jgi:hypothetical protein